MDENIREKLKFKINKKIKIPETNEIKGTGWIPSKTDPRDYTIETPVISEMLDKLGIHPGVPIPTKVDLRQYCTEIDDQLMLGSCTANAAVGIIEYFENKLHKKYIEGSRLFVYKVGRDLDGIIGDNGLEPRTCFKSLVLVGVPPEKYWPYTDEYGPIPEIGFNREPPALIYALAKNYEAVKYYAHDPMYGDTQINPSETLTSIKTHLAAKIPSMFGFATSSNSIFIGDPNVKGGIPYPCPNEQTDIGHSVVAVGYDDNMKIQNTQCSTETTGALLIRNSWGTQWGDNGYGWLPYDYILNWLAMDCWSLLKMEWTDLELFGI